MKWGLGETCAGTECLDVDGVALEDAVLVAEAERYHLQCLSLGKGLGFRVQGLGFRV